MRERGGGLLICLQGFSTENLPRTWVDYLPSHLVDYLVALPIKNAGETRFVLSPLSEGTGGMHLADKVVDRHSLSYSIHSRCAAASDTSARECISLACVRLRPLSIPTMKCCLPCTSILVCSVTAADGT